MPTFGQGAPGTRIRLRDASSVNLVRNPNLTAGVVGYSSRGELNKIIDLTSTAEQDTILGNGYNNPKFNQGLYAARAILNAGGYVEYVRPFGEEVIEDDTDPNYDTNQELKTDTFLVEYDFSDAATTSFDIKHYASTRYIQDGLATKGSREIHTIAKTLVENSNVDFELNADAQDDAGSGTDKVSLFALMNSDPTASNRAGDRFSISTISASGDTTVSVTTSSAHGFAIGDEISIAGTVAFNETSVLVDTVAGATTFTYESVNTITAVEESGAIFKNDDTEESGVDFINVKTVATGKATKKYDYLQLSPTVLPVDGETFEVVDADNNTYTLEFGNDSFTTAGNLAIDITQDTFTIPTIANISDAAGTVTVVTADAHNFVTGDIVDIADTTNFDESDVTITVVNVTTFTYTSTSTGAAETTGTVPTTAITVATGTKFLVGDAVLADSTPYLVTNVSGDRVDLVENNGLATATKVTTVGTVVNQTAILRNIANALSVAGYANNTSAKTTFDGSLVNAASDLIQLGNGDSSNFAVNDYVMFSDIETDSGTTDISTDLGITPDTIYLINSVDIATDTISIKEYGSETIFDITGASGSATSFRILNLSDAKVSFSVNDGNQKLRLDIVGTFSMKVPVDIQDSVTTTSFVTEALSCLSTPVDMNSVPAKTIASTTDGIVLDDAVGRTFLSLGLAIEDYQDIDFDGDQDRIFILTAEGEKVARIFLFVDYFFAGELYSFSGTITPYVYNDLNLDISEQARNQANGWEFVVNENISLENAILDPNFDLSQSIFNGNIESEFVEVAFNENDPAIVNDAIWEYDPRNNKGSAMLAQSWQLFLDKDRARSDMLISAGTAISNLFIKNFEQINYTVMDTMLDICEKRKDLFAIFDGVDEKKVDSALKKMVGIGSQGDISRWGGIFDGRSIFFDSVYTRLNVEAVKSIEVAAIITLNRAANVYWLAPAGFETGRIPAALSSRQKYIRTYNYADDPNSDIARLYDANINPTRVNDQGQFIYGQKTMLKRLTALNRLNVIMLVAGIHKRFANFLDRKVFQLNTPALRNGITSELQAQLELIKSANPAGLTEGVCICDDTNNPPNIIDTNQLIVDIFLQPTRTAEFITLRTTVQRTGDTASIVSAQLIGG